MGKDITETGPIGLKGLKGVNNIDADIIEINKKLRSANTSDILKIYSPSSPVENVGLQLAELGYGESEFDKSIVDLDQLHQLDAVRSYYKNLEDERKAQEQGIISKLANGLLQATVTAGTTFVDGVAGTIYGLGHMVNHWDDVDNFTEAMDYFVDNPLSRELSNFRDAVAKFAPVRLTREQQEGPWYKKGFTNFLAQDVLSGIGFAVGAAYSGKLTASAASRIIGANKVRQAFKGVVVNSAGDPLKSGSAIAKAYKAGDAYMDGAKLTEDLAKSAHKLKNMETGLKIFGSVTAAMGEARIEAIGNANDITKMNRMGLEDYYKQGMLNIENDIYSEHPEFIEFVPVRDPEGNVVGWQKSLNEEGKAELERRQNMLTSKYEEGLAKIEEDRAKITNGIFWANTALITASNLWSIGNFIAGGYTAGKYGKGLVKGTVKEGFTANTKVAKAELAKAISVPFTEGFVEEGGQSAIAEIAGLKYGSELNSFYGAKINPDAEEKTLDWLGATIEGLGNVYGNMGEHGGEIVSGMLIGALGIPSIKKVKNKQGKTRLSIGLNSEFIEGIKDYSRLKKEATDVASALNARVQSEDFKNYYSGAIRHQKYQTDMEAALDKGDPFDYKNAESSQFVSDAILFDRAGRLQDLYDIIEEQGNVTIEDAKAIRELLRDKVTGESIYDSLTDEQIVEKVKKNTSDAKAKLDTYVKISNDLKTLYGDKVSSDTLEELTWMLTQIDDWEGRTKSIIKNLKDIFSDKTQVLKDRLDIDINATFNNIEEALTTLTAKDDNIIDEINTIISDANASVEEKRTRVEFLIKEKTSKRQESGRRLGRDINHIKKVAKLKRAELEKRFKDVSSRLPEFESKKESIRQAYLEELDRLTKEMYDFYLENSYYADLKLDDLRVQAVDAFESFESQTSDLNAALKAVEDHLYREIFVPMMALDNSNGQSTWETNRIGMARARQAETSNALFSQIVALKELLTSEEFQFLDPLNNYKIANDITDLIKLYTSRAKFISLYTQLAANPELFTEAAQKEMEDAVEAIRNKEISDLIKSIKESNIDSVKGLREILKEVEAQTQSAVIEELSKDEDTTLSKVAKEYKNIEEAGELLINILRGRTPSENIQSVFNIVMDAYENAESVDDLMRIISQGAYTIGGTVADELNEIITEYNSQKESKDITRKDERKPKKKRRKKNKIIEEGDKEESNNEEEEIDEEDDEVEIPTGGIFGRAAKDTDEPDVEEIERYKEDDSELEKETQNSSSEELEKLVEEEDSTEEEDTEVEPTEDTSVEEKPEKKKKKKKIKRILAIRELERRENPPVTSSDEDTFDGNSETNQAPKPDASITPHLTSWAITQYSFNELKDMRRMAVEVEDPRVPILKGLGAFDFVDNGSLGDLFNEDEDLPIHYISVASGPLKNTILLAIEVTPNVKPINPITAQNGKQYQVVGTLGSSNDSKSKSAYKKLKRYLDAERDDAADEYFVSDFTNKISHLYSGRMVKSKPGEPVRERPLQDILHGETPILGVFYTNGYTKVPLLSSDDEVVPFNTYNENPRKGSLWLMVKEADGRYYAKAVKVARFHPDSYDAESNRNSPIIQEILECIRTIVDPNNSDYDKILAKDQLKDLLYFPGKTNIVFKTLEEETVISISGFENNIGEGLDIEEKVEAIFEALQSEELNLRFQVKTSKLDNLDYIQKLLDSNILTTDLLQMHNVNASFDMYIPSFNDDGTPESIERTSEYPKGHTGSSDRKDDLYDITVIHNGVEYRIDEEGIFGYVDSKKNYIKDQNLIDEIIFVQKIQAGLVTPIKGNSKLYIGHYSDGTIFGVLNNKVIVGDKLNALIEKANKVSEKNKSEESLESMFEQDEDFNYETEEDAEDADETIDDSSLEDEESDNEVIDFGNPEDNTFDAVFGSTNIENEMFKLEEDFSLENVEDTQDSTVRGLSEEYQDDSVEDIDDLTTISPSFDSLVRANIMEIAQRGFTTTQEVAEFLSKNGKNPNEITTQEEFEDALETIDKCRK